jgi:hypothetical protein
MNCFRQFNDSSSTETDDDYKENYKEDEQDGGECEAVVLELWYLFKKAEAGHV